MSKARPETLYRQTEAPTPGGVSVITTGGSTDLGVFPALTRVEEREAGISALRAALIEGEESGASTLFDFEAFIARKQKRETP